MATINGAAAIGMDAEIGSIEMGKRADAVFLSVRDLRLPMISGLPTSRELAEYLVTHLTARNVTEVMINGQFAVSGGELATITEADILSGFRTTLAKWYTTQATAEEPTAKPSGVPLESLHQAKIIPFVPREAPEVPEHEGFEEGFTVIGPRPGIPKVDQSSPRPSPPAEESLKPPELPTDVRREFGEDEDA
jgi:hypothetical protein